MGAGFRRIEQPEILNPGRRGPSEGARAAADGVAVGIAGRQETLSDNHVAVGRDAYRLDVAPEGCRGGQGLEARLDLLLGNAESKETNNTPIPLLTAGGKRSKYGVIDGRGRCLSGAGWQRSAVSRGGG